MNEGCHGGWGFFDSLYLEQHGAISASCGNEYSGSLSEEGCSIYAACEKVAGVSDTYYVGPGFYGGMSEADMIKELRVRGPILFDFNANSVFQAYSGGIMEEEGVNALANQF